MIRADAACAATLAGALVALTAGHARAQQRDPREVEAKKACLGGHADRGIELLADLYADTNDATYIYNQGRCFEQNGRAADAATRFREYLRKASNVAADERARVQKHVDELEAAARPASAAPPPSAVQLPAAPAPMPAPAPTAVPEPGPSRPLRVAAAITGGVGVLALAGAGVMGWRAVELTHDVDADTSMHKYDPGKISDGNRAQLLEEIGYGLGGAAAIGAVVLYYLSSPRAERGAAPLPAVTASIGPGGAGAAVQVAF